MRVYNSCLYNLLGFDLKNKSIDEQIKLLSASNILPFYCRLMLRLSLFYYKILDNQILSSIKKDLVLVTSSYKLRLSSKNIFTEPICLTLKNSK